MGVTCFLPLPLFHQVNWHTEVASPRVALSSLSRRQCMGAGGVGRVKKENVRLEQQEAVGQLMVY